MNKIVYYFRTKTSP